MTNLAPLPLTSEAFREVGSRYATGVIVVTTYMAGADHAMTANSFTTVSLDPLLVLVCVERSTRFHEVVIPAGIWGVNMMPSDEVDQATWFSTKGRPLAGQFDRVAHHRGPKTGVLLLDSSLATIEVCTTKVHRAGDHDIVVGQVTGLAIAPAAPPLTYWARRYQRLPELPA